MPRISVSDAGAFLSLCEAESIDLIVSSPPYCMGREYDRSGTVPDFVKAHEEILPEIVRVTKPGGSICWQVGHHLRDGVAVPLDAIVYGIFSQAPALKLRNRIVWTFGHGAHCRNRFSGRHETILWFTKGDSYFFDLDAVRVAQKYPGKRHYKGSKRGQPSGNPHGKNPGDVWDIPNVKANHVEKTEHPCQFPVALVQRLVKALCPSGGVVADPYMGSGSSAVAALIEGRHFVGCDSSVKYIAVARDRLTKLGAGTLKFRHIDQPIYVPQSTQSVARRPDEWALPVDDGHDHG